MQKVDTQKETPGFSSNTKREKFQYKNRENKEHKEKKDKENDFGLEEPRRFINSKKLVANENQNTQETKTEEAHREVESVNNENQHYGTEYRK